MDQATEALEWEKLLAHAVALQAKMLGAVVVGGTAATLPPPNHHFIPRLFQLQLRISCEQLDQ